METVYEVLIGQGILGVFLVLVIVYHLKTVKDLKIERTKKAEKYAEIFEKKDNKIESLNDELRQSERESITVIKELNQTLKELIAKLS